MYAKYLFAVVDVVLELVFLLPFVTVQEQDTMDLHVNFLFAIHHASMGQIVQDLTLATASEQDMQECYVKFLNVFLGAKIMVFVNNQTTVIALQLLDGTELIVIVQFVQVLVRMGEFADLRMFVIVLARVTLDPFVQ